MHFRRYAPEDNLQLYTLFFNTVHTVNARDYTSDQLDAWAPKSTDPDRWCAAFANSFTLIAETGGLITGFGNLNPDGELDRLYIHKDYQQRGTASAIVSLLEQFARKRGLPRIHSHVSITARPFFEKRGYCTVCENYVKRGGVILINYKMFKNLKQSTPVLPKEQGGIGF